MTTNIPITAAVLAACAFGVAGSPVPASSSEPVGRWDRKYLSATVQGARFEIAAGHVAQRHSTTKTAKALADRFVADHSAELKDVLTLAKRLGVNAPRASPSPNAT